MLWIAFFLIVAGVALFVAAPLGGGIMSGSGKTAAELERERLEHERALAVQGLRDLEFDFEMGKLSDVDCESLRSDLESRALKAMAAIEKLDSDAKASAKPQPRLAPKPAPAPEPRVSPPQPRPVAAIGSARTLSFCPQCGIRAARDAKFCGECGSPLRGIGRSTGWSD